MAGDSNEISPTSKVSMNETVAEREVTLVVVKFFGWPVTQWRIYHFNCYTIIYNYTFVQPCAKVQIKSNAAHQCQVVEGCSPVRQ